MKKNIKFLIFLAAIVLVVTVTSACGKSFPNDLTVNGEKITQKEYETALAQVEYDTEMYIQSTFDKEMSDDFWSNTYDGKEGYAILTDKALDRIKYVHAVYDLAYEAEDIDDRSFEAIAKRCEKENRRRKEAVQNGEVIYGLKEYSFDLYEQYEMSMLKETYCNSYDRDGMTLSQQEVEEHYHSQDWFIGEDAQKASFDDAKIAVERDLREQKYDEIVENKAASYEIKGNDDRLVAFTETVIK